MGPLEKMRAFGVSFRDIPLGLSAAYEKLNGNFAKHAQIYDQAAEDLRANYGGLTPEYNYAKGFFGGHDYGLRTERPQEESEKIARLYQFLHSLRKGSPSQDLLDLEANLAGLRQGYKDRGQVRPTHGPITDPDQYFELLKRAKARAEK